MHKNNKKNFLNYFSTIRFKITYLSTTCMFVALAINFFILIPGFQNSLFESASSNLLDLSKAYGFIVNSQLEDSADGTLSAEKLSSTLKDVQVNDLKSSYAYFVSNEGTMLYHPTPEKIGAPVENQVVSHLVSEIKQGNYPEPDIITYDFKGVKKLSSYYICPSNHSILVVTADYKEIFASAQSTKNSAFFTAVFCLIICTIIGFLLTGVITKPLSLLTKQLGKISALDFSDKNSLSKLSKQHDETGKMARTIGTLLDNLHDIVYKINETSANITNNTEQLYTISTSVNEHSTDNSSTSQQLAASMQETSATTEAIDANIIHINTNTSIIKNKIEDGASLSQEIMGRASQLKESTIAARKRTDSIYQSVKEQSAIAIEQSKSVEKINVLAETIMAIADQTSLLALNASIEAARAGESGKGFAVVANEISNLANQSTETVSNISTIVSEVNVSVDNISDCLEKTLSFLETTVSSDYSNFIDVSERYSTDATEFKKTISDIHTSITELVEVTKQITDAISGINTTIGESSIGITDIAERTSDIVALTVETRKMVEESQSFANNLKNIVAMFQL